ncbi:MAG: lysophospholipid acyltransferase family protein [Chloroflexi bacterium]|nr:lysophospholipid acyltransferase family protein [Chloroflexota bacterium]
MRIVPRTWLYILADLLAPLVVFGWRGHYLRAAANMRQILGPSATARDVHRRTRQVFRNYARYMIDVLWLPSTTRAERERVCTVVGWDHIPNALARGKGLVLVTGHVGNWDLPAAVLAGRGYPVNTIVDTLEPPAWNARVQEIRRRVGMNTIPIETGVRDLYAALRRNEVVAVVFDRPMDEGGVPASFFGRETRLPEGVARLALRDGSPVLGAVGIRRGNRFIALVSPPIPYTPTGRRDEDVRALTQRVANWLESRVRQYPDQWYMFRRFWRPHTGFGEYPDDGRSGLMVERA